MLVSGSHPTLGLSISANHISFVAVTRTWRWRAPRISVRQSLERQLPQGLVRLSATSLNVAKVSSLAKEIQTLLNGYSSRRRPRFVGLNLSDLCARLMLFTFESWPHKNEEREALLRFRFQKELNLPPNGLRIVYKSFTLGAHPTPIGLDSGSAERRPTQVLALAIRQDILGQYEQACLESGLIPVRVGLTSLMLFDLWRPTMSLAVNASAEDCFFLYVSDDSMAFFAVRAGCPLLVRIKSLSFGQNASMQATSHVLATLDFYREAFPHAQTASSTGLQPCFVTGPHPPGLLLDPEIAATRGVREIRLPWTTMMAPCRSSGDETPAETSHHLLPALAAIMEG